jgi:hypothetical protein
MRKTVVKAAACLALLALIAAPSPALAGPASDAVKEFYSPVGFEPDPDIRDRFVDPAKTIFEQHDKSTNNGDDVGCIDFVLAVDAQDFDQSVVDKTLKLTETVSGDDATVTARARLFPGGDDAPRQIRWFLKNVGGAWKVADIQSMTNDWKLSEFDCNRG